MLRAATCIILLLLQRNYGIPRSYLNLSRSQHAKKNNNNKGTPRLFLQLSNIALNMQIQFCDFVVQRVERRKLLFFYLLHSLSSLCLALLLVFCVCLCFLELSTLSVYFAYWHSTGSTGARTRMLRAHIKFNFVFEFRSKS